MPASIQGWNEEADVAVAVEGEVVDAAGAGEVDDLAVAGQHEAAETIAGR